MQVPQSLIPIIIHNNNNSNKSENENENANTNQQARTRTKIRKLSNELILFGHGLSNYPSEAHILNMLQEENIIVDHIEEVRMIGRPNEENKKIFIIIKCRDPATTDNLRKDIMKWIPTQSIRNVSRVEFYNPSRLRTENQNNNNNNYNS